MLHSRSMPDSFGGGFHLPLYGLSGHLIKLQPADPALTVSPLSHAGKTCLSLSTCLYSSSSSSSVSWPMDGATTRWTKTVSTGLMRWGRYEPIRRKGLAWLGLEQVLECCIGGWTPEGGQQGRYTEPVEATSCKSTIDPIASLRAGSWGDMERPCVVMEYPDILMDCTEREIFRSSLHPQTQLLMVRA